MKMIFVVFVAKTDRGREAIADTIKVGEDLVWHSRRYNAETCHLCGSRKEADALAFDWNAQFRLNKEE